MQNVMRTVSESKQMMYPANPVVIMIVEQLHLHQHSFGELS